MMCKGCIAVRGYLFVVFVILIVAYLWAKG